MTMTINRYDATAEYFFIEGCFINELSNTDADPHVSIARARVIPDVTTHWHRLNNTVERYVILEGQGKIEVGTNIVQPVMPGDVIVIPAMTRQRITNTGTTDLVFLAICSPRFQQENYITC